MSQIRDTETALLALIQTCQLPAEISIESAPSEWSPGYIQKLVESTPAVRVAFLGAGEYPGGDTSTALSLLSRWGLYVIVGWSTANQVERRMADGAGYDLLERLAPIVHNPPARAFTNEANEILPAPQVTGVEVLTDPSLEQANLWIAAIDVEVSLPLEIAEDCVGPLDDFLKIRGPLVVPDPADDLQLAIDLEQT